MEVSQPVASEASAMTVDPSPCVHAEHTGADTAAESGGELTAVSAGDVVYASVDGSNPGCGNVHSQDVNSVTLDVAQSVDYECKPEVTAVVDGENVVNNENPADMHAHSVGYESVNGSAGELGSYQSSGAIENGIPSNEAGAPAAEQHLEDVNSAEEDRLWSIVKANCLDFNAWTALIDETERVSENNIQKIRKVYDAFLAEFPLCFGYWKKYADHEGRLDSVNRVVEVYERAVHAVTYSVDIWLHYCVFAISTYEDPDTIRSATLMSGGKPQRRSCSVSGLTWPMCSPPFQGHSMSISSGRLFERGLAFVGSDYLSYPLWDEYIRYEEAQQAWFHLAMIYTRILENPIQQLDRYFLCLKDLAASRPLSEIRIAEEVTVVAASMNTDNPCLEGELRPDGAEQSPKPVDAGLTEVEELEKYIAAREELYKKTKELESKIIGFETAIRRPYFHVRPLDDPELENWHNYLDFIEKENDINKVIKLYERCLIACANYPEFWIRYALYMESSGNMELAYNALARATHCFVKKQPEIHLFAARFKELCGDIEGARAVYELLYSEISPCLLEAIIKNANMEYRVGNKEAAYSIYEKIIAAEKEKEHSRILPMLLVQYSRFLYLVTGDLEKARDVLFGSLGQVQLSKSVIEAVIHLETIQPQPKRIDYLDSLVEKFILPNSDNTDVASTTDREEISCIFLEFLDLFGDVQSIKKADNRHAKLFLRQKSSLVSKKRQAEDFLAADKTKVSRTSTDAASSSQSVVGAYPNAQNQWTSGYAQRAPWPQNSQVQGQQWNPGYAPQAAYNAYGYANYGAPQIPMPTSAPQTAAAYGSYPPAYPAQGYPQQTYAQPSPAVATYPQQGSAPPQYYGSYY